MNENNHEVEPWTPIYDNETYWTPERLRKESHKFKNVATVFRRTHLKDEQGRDLFLNCLDIDSDNVYNILFHLQNRDTSQKYSFLPLMQRVTFVTKTHKRTGFHIYWLSHKLNYSIGVDDCHSGYEFEIKTDKKRGHCTLPESTHREDKSFRYKNYGQEKLAISDDLYNELLELLKDCLKSTEGSRHRAEPSARSDYMSNIKSTYDRKDILLTEEEIQRIYREIRPYYRKGCRDEIIFSLTGFLVKCGIAKESAKQIVELLTRDDEEAKTRLAVLEGTYKKDPNEVSGRKRFFEALEYASRDRSIAADIFHKIFQIILDKWNKGNDEEVDPVVMTTTELLKEFRFKTLKDTGEILYYDENKGLYVNGTWLIEEQSEILFPNIGTYEVKEISNHIRRRTGIERSRFDSNPEILNLQNGLLNIETLEFGGHYADYLSLVQLPVVYNPHSRCPNILKFLGQVLQPKDFFTVLQTIGYCLCRNSIYEKAVMLVGEGSNGKSVLINLIEALLGEGNVSHASLQELNDDRFARADLYGKLANTFADLPGEKLLMTGIFKALVSGDSIRAQRKHQQPFSFRNYATLIFSTNTIPASNDNSNAYFRRWNIIKLDRTFDENSKDPNLLEKLIRKEEL